MHCADYIAKNVNSINIYYVYRKYNLGIVIFRIVSLALNVMIKVLSADTKISKLSDKDIIGPIFVLCEHTGDGDLNLFLHEALPYFDACVVAENNPEESLFVPADGWPEKVCACLNIPDPDDNKAALLEYARKVGAEWVCFMTSEEGIDYRFDRIREATDTSAARPLAFYHVICRDREHYFDVEGSWNGFVCRPRMYRLAKCRDEDILDPESELNRSAMKTTVLLHTCISEKQMPEYGIDLFTGVYDMQGVYRVQDRFENNEMIPDEELLGMIERKLSIIGEYFLNKKERINYIGLYTGDSGVALLLSHFYLRTGDQRYLDKMNEYLDHIGALIEKGEDIITSFCNGLAGYGWLLCYLRDKGLVEVGEKIFTTLDEVLEENIDEMLRIGYFDQLHGLISLGRYFLKRNDKRLIERILYLVRDHLDVSGGETKWDHTLPGQKPSYHFGIAHGMAGVLYFIGKCYCLDIQPELCRELGNGIVAFFDNNEQDIDKIGDYYPFSVPSEEYAERRKNYSCRHAWCNGDIGVLYAMFLYGKWTKQTQIEQRAIEKLMVTCRKRDCLAAGIHDAGACHGSVSIAHFYNRLYCHTGESLFRETAVYWLKATLILGRNADAPTGYIFYYGEKGWLVTDDLLNGVCGVGLGLLSAVDANSMDWDETMMLS